MKKQDLQGSLDLLVLTILSRRPKLHGYAIMTAIRESSGEVLSAEEGSLYPALHRMEEAGWIRAEWVVKVFEETMNSVSVGSRSRVASTKSAPSTLETNRNVIARSL